MLPRYVTVPLFSVILYIAFLITSSIYYHGYLRKKLSKSNRMMLYFVLLTYLIILFIMFSRVIIIIQVIMRSFFVAVLLAVMTSLMFKQRKFKCSREDVARIDDKEYVICYSDIVNAWYNPKTRRYYVSSRLREVITDSELKAILLHEEGHAHNKLLSWISSIVFVVWLISIISLALFVPYFAKIANIEPIIVVVGFFAPLAPSITLIAMLWSWLNEHEADVNALEKIGFEPIATALIKVHIYGLLGRYQRFVNEIKFKPIYNIKDGSTVNFGIILLTLLKYSLNVPLWLIDLIKRPMYKTHPPLELRLVKLIHST